MARPMAGDQRWVRERDAKLRKQALQDEADLREMLAIPAARRYMLRLIAKAGVFSGGFEANGSRLYAREGVRSFGLDIVRDVSTAYPGLIESMLRPPEVVEDSADVAEKDNDEEGDLND